MDERGGTFLAVATHEKTGRRRAAGKNGQEIHLASLYPNEGLGKGAADHHRKRGRKYAHRRQREDVSRRSVLALGDGPRPPEKRNRQGRRRAARQDRPFHPSRAFQRSGGSSRRETGQNCAEGAYQGVLLRQRFHRRRDRAQDRLSILAAEWPRASEKNRVPL